MARIADFVMAPHAMDAAERSDRYVPEKFMLRTISPPWRFTVGQQVKVSAVAMALREVAASCVL